MSNVLTFKPRPKPAAADAPEPLAGAELRAQIEAGVQAALDLADHYIAVLNGIDGCPNLEDGGNAEPSVAAPENTAGSQVVYMRGGDQDREVEAPEIAIPETKIEAPPAAEADLPADASVIHIKPLRWGGTGNVVSLAGATVLDLSVAAGGALLALARRS